MELFLDKFAPLLLAAVTAACLGYYFSTRIQKADIVNKKKDYFLKLLEKECLKLYKLLDDENESIDNFEEPAKFDEQLLLVNKFIFLAFKEQKQVKLKLRNGTSKANDFRMLWLKFSSKYHKNLALAEINELRYKITEAST